VTLAIIPPRSGRSARSTQACVIRSVPSMFSRWTAAQPFGVMTSAAAKY
jgi:hypothetical protein